MKEKDINQINKDIDGLINDFIGGEFFQINKVLLKFLGAESAIWLSYIWNKRSYFKEKKMVDGQDWFYLYKESIFEDTGIPLHKQTEIIKDLQEINILAVKRGKEVRKNYYKINPQQVFLYCKLFNEGLILSLFESHNFHRRKDVFLKVENAISPLIIYKNNIEYIISDKNNSKELYNESSDSFYFQEPIGLDLLIPLGNEGKEPVGTTSAASNSVGEQYKIISGRPPIRKRKIDQNPPAKKEWKFPLHMKNILQTWLDSGLVQHSRTVQAVQNASRIVNQLKSGVFFNNYEEFKEYHNYKFTEEDIISAINNFGLAAVNLDYEPSNQGYKASLRKNGIDLFFYNPRWKEKSLFLKYFENKPELVSERNKTIEDPDPEMTRIIKDVWVKEFLNNVWPKDNKFPSKAENDFRKCTKELTDWYNRNKRKIPGEFDLGGDHVVAKRNKALLLMAALKASVRNNSEQICQIHTGWLCSEDTISRRLPQYLGEQGVTDGDKLI